MYTPSQRSLGSREVEKTERTHRISAGAIIIKGNKILLVKSQEEGRTFLVCPGGGVNPEEGLQAAAIREVKEETGLDIQVGKIVFIEDLYWRTFRVTKIWFLCEAVGGKLERTPGAIEEKIINVKWYSRDELDGLLVYPRPITETDWSRFSNNGWEARYLEIKQTDFRL